MQLKYYKLLQKPGVKIWSCSDYWESYLSGNDSWLAWGPSQKGDTVVITEASCSLTNFPGGFLQSKCFLRHFSNYIYSSSLSVFTKIKKNVKSYYRILILNLILSAWLMKLINTKDGPIEIKTFHLAKNLEAFLEKWNYILKMSGYGFCHPLYFT